MKNKIKDKRYDIVGHPSDTSDDMFTTDLSDEGSNQIYRQYKLRHYEAKKDHHELSNKVKELEHAVREASKGRTRDSNTRPIKVILGELQTKKFKQSRNVMEIEQYLGALRMMSELQKMSPIDAVEDKHGNRDVMFSKNWTPLDQVARQAKED